MNLYECNVSLNNFTVTVLQRVFLIIGSRTFCEKMFCFVEVPSKRVQFHNILFEPELLSFSAIKRIPFNRGFVTERFSVLLNI